MIKRSRTIAITILGAAAFTLAGCQEEQVDAQAFPDLQSCTNAAQNGGAITVAECDASFAAAAALHVEAAPRYDSLAVCEEQHGEGACGTEEAQTQSGSSGIFMPLMMGYLIGSMMSNRAGMAASQPLYQKPGGGFTNAAGTSNFSNNAGAAKLNTSQFTRPATTAGQAPMSRGTAAARGGFGNSSAGRTSTGG
ncbi:Uncharacterized conserved protein YgiB, involved in bioifilm formation, UPF0441/DUF1190 family [Pseudorhodobacter antarcticus]|uniref:Uncharacterized conserved protein YgiB, involved in bioifilm formation, UPF0441/DUF1190 family n=1 Tax=Pseudorhodobacter antarcticus TaxID=1077947 RepID=A0A1H8CJ15_9RHOB|nr:DUF1190 domain-containing protein [Pseudorhodobacter antarcticus]SEM95281.1 Uncharacterized conserved protein YgiB, involved in bioifilm formation, UPF0441/DUF1190 family [Pseudorhodobacter antarcticus]